MNKNATHFLLLIIVLALLAAGCSSAEQDSGASEPGVERESTSGRDEFSEERADTPPVENSDSEDTEADNDSSGTGLTFHGYTCRVDCSGHEAGYEWAEEKGITDPEDCGGNSESFIEGCRAYAEEEGGVTDGGFQDDEDEDDVQDEEDDEE